jgi:hypothetical protein
MITSRLGELATFLGKGRTTLVPLHRRFADLRDLLARLDHEPGSGALILGHRRELDAVDRRWRLESESVLAAILAYEHYRACARRIATGSAVLPGRNATDPLGERVVRQIAALTAGPLR